MSKKVLFAVSSLGLGHATRSLVIIQYLLNKNYDITIFSYGNALKFLKTELKDIKEINYIEFKDYPPIERGEGFLKYIYLLFDIISIDNIVRKETKFVKNQENNFDLIISDGRYGVYNRNIKSYLLSHQISFIPPEHLGFLGKLANYVNYLYLKKFDKVLIPDFEEENHNLAGKLSHNWVVEKLNCEYIGILSIYEKEDNVNQDIDYLFIITGYLLEHKGEFINTLIDEAKKLDGKKVFVLGDTSKDDITKIEEYDITIYPYITGENRNNLMNRSKVVISRSGYTTIMDLVKLQKKAILFPTPNQTEQEYLARYLSGKNYFVAEKQSKDIDLKKLVEKLDNTVIFKGDSKNLESIDF